MLKEQRKKVSSLSFGDESDGMVHGAGIGIRILHLQSKMRQSQQHTGKRTKKRMKMRQWKGHTGQSLSGKPCKEIHSTCGNAERRREQSRRLKESVLDEAERSRLIFETAYGNEAKDAVKREAEKKRNLPCKTLSEEALPEAVSGSQTE